VCITVYQCNQNRFLPLAGGCKGLTAGVGFLAKEIHSLIHSGQACSGAHPSSCLSSRVKQPGREVDHLPQSSAEVMNGGAIPPLPMSSWHVA
jgi:hypothetical protein